MAKRFSKIAILLMLVLALLVPMMVMSVGAEEQSATLTFDDTTKRTVLTTSQQIWVENGITLTNNKGSSTSNVANYANPARFYKSSEVIIEATGNITKIEFTCNSSRYASELKNSVTNGEVSVSGSVVTITLTTSATSYTIDELSAQVRVNSLTVYYENNSGDNGDSGEEDVCNHTATYEVVTKEPTHGVVGSANIVCKKCEEVQGTKELPALWTASFVVPEGASVPVVEDTATVTLPEAIDAPSAFDKYDYNFVGWALSSVDDTTSKPTIYKAGDAYPLTEDTTFYAVYSYGFGGSSEYKLTKLEDINDGDSLVVTMTKGDTVYALYNGNGTSAAPNADTISVSDGKLSSSPDEKIIWNFESLNDGNFSLYIYDADNGGKLYLYCTNINNGVRVGTNANRTFVVDSATGYIKNVVTNRYVGVYRTTPDWRCYDNTTGNTAGQTLGFYVLSSGTIYYTTSLEVAAMCEHEKTTTETKKATCTTTGYTKVTCSDCGFTISDETISATGHQNTTETTVEATCTETGTKTVTCDDCGATVDTDSLPIVPHNYVDGECDGCGKKETDYSGEYYIGALRKDVYYYILGEMNGTRYNITDSSLTGWPKAIYDPVDLYTFVIEKIDDDTYVISTKALADKNYLGWKSENSGVFVSKEEALHVTIDKLESGLYNIHFTASDAERYLAINSTTYSYSAWYKGEVKDLALIPVKKHIEGASLEIGKDLSVLYHVNLANGNDGKYSMVFTMNGVETVVDAVEEIGGKYYFRFKGIAPQMMGENISAELLYDGELVAEKAEYSVLEYCNYYLSGDGAAECSTELAQLLKNLLAYGAEAQKYTNTNTDKLVNAGIDSATASLPTEEDEKVNTKEEGVDGYIASAGVVFSHDIKIFFTFKNLSEDVSVKLNGEEISIEGDKYYTDGISALDFNEFITLEFVVDGKTVQTVKYSVNAYVHAIYNNDTMSALSIALYNYGLAAEAYDSSITGN